MFSYSPPADIDDLAGRPTRSAFLNSWHKYIHDSFVDNIGNLGANPMFFSEVDQAATSPAVPIGWNAFPLSILRLQPSHPDAWKAADQLKSTTDYTPTGAPPVTTQFRPQDEYCEWHAYREGGKLKRIVFTAEGPEYWIWLANADFNRVVELYQTYVDAAVKPADLKLAHDIDFDGRGWILPAGSYDPFNRWNTTDGVMHLTHPANTLGAEINLAAFASIPHKDHSGNRVDDVRRLICCAGYGNANRSSDPSIGFAVNTACMPLAAGAPLQDATLANPVGLYIKGLQAGVLTGPAGEPIDNWFKFVRGQSGKGLMAVLEAPAGATFGLDQVKVRGVALERGGQVAEAIDMVLYAKVAPRAAAAPPLTACTSACCMPNGTPPSQIKNVSLSQVQASKPCAAGKVRAYPELQPIAVPANGLFELIEKGVVGGKKLKTRLAGE